MCCLMILHCHTLNAVGLFPSSDVAVLGTDRYGICLHQVFCYSIKLFSQTAVPQTLTLPVSSELTNTLLGEAVRNLDAL